MDFINQVFCLPIQLLSLLPHTWRYVISPHRHKLIDLIRKYAVQHCPPYRQR
uniref:Uncharacterized protein n=1 Tax=Utricularia reniformis TaxID=192314 RepID=A0A1Y0B086_9LAMI|nr:hypothetical protein AEK19_MT0532 [Utricularia reniformis]ART30788.1 hypothetical protein AEK19_MT0532 [Utricularia reniformis]